MNGIILYEYKGRQVIEVQSSLYSSTNLHQYYCDGTRINFDSQNSFSDFSKSAKIIKTIYGVNIWGTDKW